MIEIFVVLGCVLACFILVAAPFPPSEAIDPRGTRANATRRAELRLGGTVLAVTAFACSSLLAISYGQPQCVPLLLLVLVLVNLVLHPWFLVRWICIPLGRPLWAHRLSRLGGHPWLRDPEGGACLAGALACLRRRHADPVAARALHEHLGAAPLRGAGIVAAALLAADGGNPERARRLLESLEMLDPDACPPRARDIARQWLVADAARRGEWPRVLELYSLAPRPCRTLRLFALAARRIMGEPIPPRLLVAGWARAPRRTRTFSLLRRALTCRDSHGFGWQDVHSADDLAANDAGLPHGAAVAMHLEAASDRVDEGLYRVACAWDATLWDPGFRNHLRTRIRMLGGHRSPESTALELRRQIARDLGRWRSEKATSWRRGSNCFDAARQHVVRQSARALGRAIGKLARCGAAAPLDIWEAWLDLRERHARLVASCDDLRLRPFYDALDHVVAGLIVHLHQVRGQRPVAHAISLWLVQEAERVHDADAAAHHGLAVVLGP